MLLPLLAFAQHAPPARPFQRFDGCIYKPQRWNDGDSFHVILPDGKEVIFRLYFLDTPEEERVYASRIAEQAAYFGITPDAAIQIGREASEFTKQAFTKQALTKPFTIYTRWRRALGPQRDLAILRDRCHGRRLIEQLFWKERTEIEVANTMGTNQSTINRRKHDILNGLRIKLRDRNEFQKFSA